MAVKTTNYKEVKEMTVTQFKGLRSNPISQISPDELAIGLNVYFKQEGVLAWREGAQHKFTDLEEGHSYAVGTFTNSSGVSYCTYAKNRKIYTWDGSTLNVLTYASSEDILSASTTFRGCVEYKQHMYFCDGTQYLYKVDGTSVTRIEIPLTSTYGNATNIFTFGSCLAVVTDTSYLRYTQVGVDDVWEARTVLAGTISATGTTVTGTNTIFDNPSITKGLRVIISDGTNTETRFISNVASGTSMTLNEALINSYSAGSNIFLAGTDLFEPLEKEDGLIPRKAISFGKFIAVSKASNDISRSTAKVLVYSISTRNPNASPLEAGVLEGGVKLFTQQDLSQTFTVHPFSLCEYEGNALFIADDNIYALQQAQANADKFIALPISKGKLENEMEDINTTKRNNSILSVVRKGNVNLVCAHFTEDIGSNYNNRILAGYKSMDGSFEWTEFQIPTRLDTDDNGAPVYDHVQFITYQDKVLLIGALSSVECFNPNFRFDTLTTTGLTEILISDNILISEDAVISGYVAPVLENRPIVRLVRFGTLSNENHNKLSLYRLFVIVTETATTNVFPGEVYNLTMYFNGEFPGRSLTRQYDLGTVNTTVTFDATIGNGTFDTTDGSSWNFSSTFTGAQQQEPLNYKYPQKRVTNMSLQISDSATDGLLEIRSYGFAVESTKWM